MLLGLSILGLADTVTWHVQNNQQWPLFRVLVFLFHKGARTMKLTPHGRTNKCILPLFWSNHSGQWDGWENTAPRRRKRYLFCWNTHTNTITKSKNVCFCLRIFGFVFFFSNFWPTERHWSTEPHTDLDMSISRIKMCPFLCTLSNAQNASLVIALVNEELKWIRTYRFSSSSRVTATSGGLIHKDQDKHLFNMHSSPCRTHTVNAIDKDWKPLWGAYQLRRDYSSALFSGTCAFVDIYGLQ